MKENKGYLPQGTQGGEMSALNNPKWLFGNNCLDQRERYLRKITTQFKMHVQIRFEHLECHSTDSPERRFQ